MLVPDSIPGYALSSYLRGGLQWTETKVREVFGRDEDKNKPMVPSLATTNTNLPVFHAYVRAARAR